MSKQKDSAKKAIRDIRRATRRQYSAAELSRLIEAANSVCERSGKRPELVVLRRLSSS